MIMQWVLTSEILTALTIFNFCQPKFLGHFGFCSWFSQKYVGRKEICSRKTALAYFQTWVPRYISYSSETPISVFLWHGPLLDISHVPDPLLSPGKSKEIRFWSHGAKINKKISDSDKLLNNRVFCYTDWYLKGLMESKPFI